ncbi:hypothetical protein [Streptomyces sp. NPDC093225]|uniref:hypothetical protein n=1 Tax=Streptomyces sp. NPDC093225 TaxID=3366034 RepID=UPI0037FC4443
MRQTDAVLWGPLVFEGLDDVEVEAVSAAFGTVEVVARGRAGGASCRGWRPGWASVRDG